MWALTLSARGINRSGSPVPAVMRGASRMGFSERMGLRENTWVGEVVGEQDHPIFLLFLKDVNLGEVTIANHVHTVLFSVVKNDY